MALLFIANFINIGADLAAMGAALRLLIGGPEVAYALMFGIFCAAVQVIVPYPAYVSVLKWLTLSLFAYVAVVLVVGVPWGEALAGLAMPNLEFTGSHFTAIVAVLGTTISPYLFFWQAGEEVEELRRRRLARLRRNPHVAGPELGRIRMDTLVGMGFSNLVALCIIVAAAATLHANGVHEVQTSAQAAEALKPVAGEFAFAVFAAGIIGTGLLAVPVLAGSAAYAVAESFGWPEGLDKKSKGSQGVLRNDSRRYAWKRRGHHAGPRSCTGLVLERGGQRRAGDADHSPHGDYGQKPGHHGRAESAAVDGLHQWLHSARHGSEHHWHVFVLSIRATRAEYLRAQCAGSRAGWRFRVEVCIASNAHANTLDLPRDPRSGNLRDFRRTPQNQAARMGFVYKCSADDMARRLVERGGQPQNPFMTFGAFYPADSRLSCSKTSGFVEHSHGSLGESFQGACSFDQNPFPGSL